MNVTKPSLTMSRAEELYDNLLLQHPDHWYAVLDEELIHSSERADVSAELLRRGFGPGDVLIAHAPGNPPYLVL